ncbi:hypothetical protein BDW22DRAFT_1354057 [Trametopsis cervina]|nr:hypothetical protein BDW22DRAFT_1354057 [Trametopsis cervina]
MNSRQLAVTSDSLTAQGNARVSSRWKEWDEDGHWLPWYEISWPESTGEYATAADLPPELFEIIIWNAVKEGPSWRKDGIRILCKCALVALPWAKFARAILWGDVIDSFDVGYEKATSFARANLHPEHWSPRLVPVLELLKRIRAFQRYNEPSSWLYLITSVPALRKKLTFVQLEGPVPEGFNASRLSSPYWSIPPAFARVPMFTHLVSAQLFRTHFARFADLVQLLRHFARAEQLTFADVTWGDADAPVLWPTRTTKERVETPPRRAYAANCTNNVLMAMAAHYVDSGLPLRTALASEQQKVQRLAQISYEYTTDSDVYCMPLSSSFPTTHLGLLHVACSRHIPRTHSRVVGVLLRFPHAEKCKDPSALLHKFLETVSVFSDLRVVVIAFSADQDKMRSFLPRYSINMASLPESVARHIICLRDRKARAPRDWIEIDPNTIEATGRTWKCDHLQTGNEHDIYDNCDDAGLARAQSSLLEERERFR